MLNLFKYYNKPEELGKGKYRPITMQIMAFWEDIDKEYISFEESILADHIMSLSFFEHIKEDSYYTGRKLDKDLVSKLEDTISTDANSSYYYAQDNNSTFKKGEPAISTSAEYSYYYAVYVLQDEFLDGEPAILKSKYREEYLNFLESIGKSI